MQVAVIVNDMAEVNIDADLVRGGQAGSEMKTDQLVELTNGCICCSLRDDLLQVHLAPPGGTVHLSINMEKCLHVPLQEVAELAACGRFDYLVVESTGEGSVLHLCLRFAQLKARRCRLNSM